MDKLIKEILNLNYINEEIRKCLRNKYTLNIHQLKILKYINDHMDRTNFTVSEFNDILEYNYSILTNVVTYLQDFNYIKKERSEMDERKVLLIVETRYKMKISELICDITNDLESIMNDLKAPFTYEDYIDGFFKLNGLCMNIKDFVSQKHKLNMNQFILLMLFHQFPNEVYTINDINTKLNWGMVRINKTIKALVNLNYIVKLRNKYDERIVNITINKDGENKVNKIIKDLFLMRTVIYGDKNLAMVE